MLRGLTFRIIINTRVILSGYLSVSNPLRNDMRTTNKRVAREDEMARDAISIHSVVVKMHGLGEMSSLKSAKLDMFAMTKSLSRR